MSYSVTVRSIRMLARKSSTYDIGMSQRRTVSTTARLIAWSLRAGLDVAHELLAPADQPVGLLGVGQRAAEVVDDLVGVAREAVQRVDVRPLPRRQQQRGEVVRLAVAGVEPAAGLVRRPQRRVGDARRVQLPPAHARESARGGAVGRPARAAGRAPRRPETRAAVALAAAQRPRPIIAAHSLIAARCPCARGRAVRRPWGSRCVPGSARPQVELRGRDDGSRSPSG